MSHSTVYVLNAPHGYPKYIDPGKAHKWEARGKAKFMDVGKSRLVITCERFRVSLIDMVKARIQRDSEIEYDSAVSGRLARRVTEREARGIPFTSVSKVSL